MYSSQSVCVGAVVIGCSISTQAQSITGATWLDAKVPQLTIGDVAIRREARGAGLLGCSTVELPGDTVSPVIAFPLATLVPYPMRPGLCVLVKFPAALDWAGQFTDV